MCVCSSGEEIPQEGRLLSCRHLPRGVWPSLGVGRWLPPAPSPRPLLGFRAPDQPFSDLLMCMLPFWVLAIEPSCSALPCSVLQGPHVGAHPGNLLLQALLGEAQERPLQFLCSLCKGSGVWLLLDCPGELVRVLGDAACTPHGLPTIPKPCSSPFCLGFSPELSCRGAEGRRHTFRPKG